MNIQGIFAVACIPDMDAATAWYTALMGRDPDERPMDTLTQWRVGFTGVQLVLDVDRAGQSLITVVTPDMADTRAQLAARGLVLGADVEGDFGKIAQIDDPFGNRLTLAEPPKGITPSI